MIVNIDMQAIQGWCFFNYKPFWFWVCSGTMVPPDLLATCFLSCLWMLYRSWRLMQLHHLALSQLLLVSSRISQKTKEAVKCVHEINEGKQSWELSHQNSGTHDPSRTVSDREFCVRIWSGSIMLINAGPFQGQPLIETQLSEKSQEPLRVYLCQGLRPGVHARIRGGKKKEWSMWVDEKKKTGERERESMNINERDRK